MRSELIEQLQAGLGPRIAFEAAAVSHYLVAAVAEQLSAAESPQTAIRQEFRTHRRAVIGRLFSHADRWLADRLVELLGQLRHKHIVPDGLADSLFTQAHYLERIVQLAVERLLVNPAAPPLLVSPLPEPDALTRLWAKPPIAMFFDHPLAITHELYPLWNDAYVFSLEHGSDPCGELVGVHNSWTDSQGRVQRVIVFDPALDLFLEMPLQEPLSIAAALLICQSPESHQALSSRLTEAGIAHLNCGHLAAKADDKWHCFKCWKNSGVPTPPTCLLNRHHADDETRATILGFIDRHPEYRRGWVIQPRYGTEGTQVSWIPAAEYPVDRLLEAWQTIAASQDAILRPRIGLVGLHSAAGPLPFDLRIHVLFDGAQYCAPSGYLQVARGVGAPIASIAGGGQLQPISRLTTAELIQLENPAMPATTWNSTVANAASELAKRAVQAVGPLGLSGLDLKFDYRNGRLSPSVIDLNPRPAGLLYANLFPDGEAGIGEALWRGLRALGKKRPS